jgi:hypothetical protein
MHVETSYAINSDCQVNHPDGAFDLEVIGARR